MLVERGMDIDALEPHPLIRLLGKPAADFTGSDLVRAVDRVGGAGDEGGLRGEGDVAGAHLVAEGVDRGRSRADPGEPGVLDGADNPDGAEALVDWMLSDEVQSALPESMYVFPVVPGATVPDDWARFAPQPTDPYQVAPEEIAANREQWLTEWTDVISR